MQEGNLLEKIGQNADLGVTLTTLDYKEFELGKARLAGRIHGLANQTERYVAI